MRIGRIAIITLACVTGAAAQDKITVPLTNPSQPATIRASMISGSITVTAGSGNDLIVSSSDAGKGRKSGRDSAPPGMTRIGGRPGLEIEEDHNVVTISAGSIISGADLTIEAPVNTNLQLR